MKTNKQIVYKAWIDELKQVPSDAFFPTLKQYLDYLFAENEEKIKSLRSEIEKDKKIRAAAQKKAIGELEQLLKLVISEAKKDQVFPLNEIDRYEKIKKGEILTSENHADALFQSIRITIEKGWAEGKFRRMADLMDSRDGSWFLSYAKALKQYPAYKRFQEIEKLQSEKYISEPWGALRHLLFTISFFKDSSPDRAGSFVRPEIINCLNRLVLYLITPGPKTSALDQRVSYSFDYETGALKVGNETIFFRRDTRRPLVLNELGKKRGYLYYGEFMPSLDGEGYKGAVNPKCAGYETCRGVSNRLSKRGINDFLDFDYNKARINPRYRKTS